MSVVEKDPVNEVLDRVNTWSPAQRITLRDGSWNLWRLAPSQSPPHRSLKDLVGLLKTDAPAPSDEECRQILEEELTKKYGK